MVSPEQNRRSQQSDEQIVASVLSLLASGHPTIRADDVANLQGALIDWNKLVQHDFPREWRATIDSMLDDDSELQRESGQLRLTNFRNADSLSHLLSNARRGLDDGLQELACAAILLGNLIEDAICDSNPELARVIQLQINSFYNAAANRAFSEAFGEGEILAILPEYNPKAPELLQDDLE